MNIGLATTRIMRIGLRYLLRDEFLFARAAGSVHGTAAEPGPGTRTVTDTESKLSIAGGVLTFAGGKASPGNGDPGLWYGAVTRLAGRLLLADIARDGSVMAFGWSAAASGAITNVNFAFNTTNIFTKDTGNVIVGTCGAVAYRAAAVLRATGFLLLLRGGAFGSWTLLWIGRNDATSPLYPALQSFNSVFTADNLRIPDRTWLPTPLAYDTFTRAGGALGSSESVGPDGQQTPQLAWTGATWAIASGKAVNTPTTDADKYASQSHSTTNVIADITLSAYSAGTQAGMVLRLDSAASPANFVRAYQDSGNVKIDACVAGTYTNLGSYVSAYATGDTLRVSLDGAAWRLYKITAAGAATLLGSGTTAVTTGTLHGLFSTDAANTLDSWTIWARGTGGEYAALDAM